MTMSYICVTANKKYGLGSIEQAAKKNQAISAVSSERAVISKCQQVGPCLVQHVVSTEATKDSSSNKLPKELIIEVYFGMSLRAALNTRQLDSD